MAEITEKDIILRLWYMVDIQLALILRIPPTRRNIRLMNKRSKYLSGRSLLMLVSDNASRAADIITKYNEHKLKGQ